MRLGRFAGYANLLAAGALLLVAWGLVALAASRPALKRLFDFTPQARATVDRATVDLLEELRRTGEKVEFHLFFQPLYSPPQDEGQRAEWEITSTLETLTRDLLRQYAYLGGEAVTVRDYNLDVEIEESRLAAQRFSVTSTNTVVVAVGGRHKKLSLQLDLGDIELPHLQPTAGPARRSVPVLRDYKGEEALSSAIKSLLVTGKPVVYFLTGYGEARRDQTNGGDYSILQDALVREGFEIRELALREAGSIPENATALALLEPQIDFSEEDANLLVSWLRRGGRLFVNYAWVAVEERNPTGGALGRRLGFEVTREMVFQKVRSATGGPSLDGNPQVMNLTCIYNPMHPITGPLSVANRTLSLKMGREFLQLAERPQGIRMDSIVRTGPEAWTARMMRGPTGVPVFDYVAPRLEGALGPRDVGIAIDIDGEQEGVTGHAVLLAGLAFNNLGMPVNGDLALNIFNWMAERKVLVTVRGDRYHARHVRIGKEQVDNIWWLLVVFVPGAFLLLGVAVAWRRSRWR
ncbi:MAG: hypothetical protein Fur0037_26920 [Planctomycetota bacterium]